METIMSKRICELRKKLSLTQKQLADETGLSLSAIKSYETAKREPNSKAMAALEQYFNVSGGYLRGDTDDPTPPDAKKEALSLTSIEEGVEAIATHLFGPNPTKEQIDDLALSIRVGLAHIREQREKNPRGDIKLD